MTSSEARGVALSLLVLSVSVLTGCRQTLSADTAPKSRANGARVAASAPGALAFGVLSPNIKVRPADRPTPLAEARLYAARNEFEAIQLVMHASGGPVAGVSASLAHPLAQAGGATIPAKNVTFYRVGYYEVGKPSNAEGGSGLWPDPLIPRVDTYVGEQRNAFPFDVPAGQSRSVWIDVLVPVTAASGEYRSSIELKAGGRSVGSIPIMLTVGRFALPSTPAFKTAFGMGFSQPCLAHTGKESCSSTWDDHAACRFRELYIRAGLDHRLTLSGLTFQAPFGDSAAAFEKFLLPLAHGKGETRLAGARVTSIQINAEGADVARWARYGSRVGIAKRLFWLGADEPQDSAEAWASLHSGATTLEQSGGSARVMVLSSLAYAKRYAAEQQVDIFVPALSSLDYHGDVPIDRHRSAYDAWLQQRRGREVWGYLACMSYACQGRRNRKLDREQMGWPSRLIDASGVQNRAFAWLAYIQRLSGEFYRSVAAKLSTAWQPDGQSAESGAGGGTLFYPGTPAAIGGKTHIPIESVRLKLIREGIEDFEYLRLAAQIDPELAQSVALTLFPRAFQCDQQASKLEQARAKLFSLLNRRSASL